MSSAYNIDAWHVAGALARGLEGIRDNLGDQAAEAVHDNMSARLTEIAPGFAWRDAMASDPLKTWTP